MFPEAPANPGADEVMPVVMLKELLGNPWTSPLMR
jgi:hypothetical protein